MIKNRGPNTGGTLTQGSGRGGAIIEVDELLSIENISFYPAKTRGCDPETILMGRGECCG